MSDNILAWGQEPQLQFKDQAEFYRTLGQLTNEQAFSISFEPNRQTGSYSDAYRIRALADAANITDALKSKMRTANRINCNEYVQYLIKNHGFVLSGNEVKRNFDDVRTTVDVKYLGDFVKGYNESVAGDGKGRIVYSTEKIDVSKKHLDEQDQPAPVKANVASKAKKRKSGKRDYIKIQIENFEIGEAGELLVWEYENTILNSVNFKGDPEWISRKDDSLGYDIKSYDIETGKPKYIEVKTTSGGKTTPFFISDNELECSKEHAENYYIYRVYNIKNKKADKVGFYVIKGDITKQENFEIIKTRDSLVKVKSNNE